MDSHNNRVYYTTENPVNGYTLWSIGTDDAPVEHGLVAGDLIKHNPVTNELVAVKTNTFPGTVYRYSLDSTETVVELQSSGDLGGNTQDLAFSPNGQQLVMVAGRGNGDNGYAITDIVSTDLTLSNEGWDTGPYPTSAAFSASGTVFAAAEGDNLKLFDAITHDVTLSHEVDDRQCNSSYSRISDINFSADDQHIVSKPVCNGCAITLLNFYRVP